MSDFRVFSLAFVVAGMLVLVAARSPALAEVAQIEVEAGPIWSQADAERKCPEVAKANGGAWTGQWRTTVPGRMSVCGLKVQGRRKYDIIDVEAGPIWSQADAERKCPDVARTNGGAWTGEWRTTVPGRMSVCELRVPRGKR